MLCGQNNSGDHGKRRIDPVMYIMVCKLIAYPNFSALSYQILRADFFAVQVISHLHGDRKFFVSLSLIIDVIAVGVPGDAVFAALLKSLVAFHIFNVI